MAVVIALLLVVPGLFVGSIGVWFVNFALRWSGADVDGGLISWIPGLRDLTTLWFYHLLPEGFRGGMAGAIAVGVPLFFFRRANSETVAYSTVSLYGGLTVLLVILLWIQQGPKIEMLDLAANLVGLAIGAFLSKATYG